MCGRFANFSSAAAKARHFGVPDWPEAPPQYNIAPGALVEAVRVRGGGRGCDRLSWGLLPYWAKDQSIARKTINARSESAHQSPAFRSAFFARRCLIVADGYYEWRKSSAGKQAYFIRAAEDTPVAFGGLWERWRGPEGDHYSCSILTTEPNALTRAIHERMPVIIEPKNYAAWIAPEVTALGEIQTMIAPYPAEAMRAYPVGARINDARIDDAQLLNLTQPNAPDLLG